MLFSSKNKIPMKTALHKKMCIKAEISGGAPPTKRVAACIIDPAKKSVTLINCGHPPLLHFAAAGKTINEYRTGDIALGLLQNGQFRAQTIIFHLGRHHCLTSFITGRAGPLYGSAPQVPGNSRTEINSTFVTVGALMNPWYRPIQ